MDWGNVIALRMVRQCLCKPASQAEYDQLYRDLSPGQNVYWAGFGDPPTLTFRADFDDMAYNRQRQQQRQLVKGRFQGGNLGWIEQGDMLLFAGLCRKPLDCPTDTQNTLLTLLQREGPMNIQLMKEMTGLLVKEITPALHRLQEAFLIYEDQFDGEWDRSWYPFAEMFPEMDLAQYPRQEALAIILKRFAYRLVHFDQKMAKSFYKLPEKDIKAAAGQLEQQGELTACQGGWMLTADAQWLAAHRLQVPRGVWAMHRNDFLVKSLEHALKERFGHRDFDTLQYIWIDGECHGAVVGKFKNGPYMLEDLVLDLPPAEVAQRKDEIINAVYRVNNKDSSPLKRFAGQPL